MNSSLNSLFNYLGYKKLLWPINAIVFNLLRLWLFRDKNLWIFGALSGRKYDDNSRYLFEYVNRLKQDGIRAVWLAKNNDVTSIIRNKGLEAYTYYSWSGIKTALTAGVVFYTHSLGDFGKVPLVGGAKIVCLWHGFSFKRIYNYNYSGFKAYLKKIFDSVFNWVYRDYSMVTSEYTKKQYLAEFNISNPNTIIITGQPRNDVLKNKYSVKDVLGNRYGIKEDNGIILFMPTYRPKVSRKGDLERIVNDLVNNDALNTFLEANNYVFLIKLHPMTPIFDIPKNKHFFMLDFNEIDCNQKLLAIGDYLITDYSGVFVDYALLGRPIIFYTPDKDDYIKYSGRLEEEFEYVSSLCNATNPEQLVTALVHPNMKLPETINDYFSDGNIEKSCYSENVYKTIIQRVF